MFVMFVAGLCDECCVITPRLLPRMGLTQCCFAKGQRVNIVIGVSFYFVIMRFSLVYSRDNLQF